MIYESLINFTSKICCFTSFVNTIQGFPEPLTKEEEREWLLKKEQGDPEAREVLISRNLRLVSHVVKNYANSLEADDLISVGTIGLIKAVDTFKMDKNVTLATYAARCISNEILMLIRSNKRHKNNVSLNSGFAPKNDSEELELENMIPAGEEYDVFNQVESDCLVQDIISVMKEKLSTMEFDILCYCFGICEHERKTQKEIGEIYDLSRSYISRIENKAINTIKKYMKIDDESLACDPINGPIILSERVESVKGKRVGTRGIKYKDMKKRESIATKNSNNSQLNSKNKDIISFEEKI